MEIVHVVSALESLTSHLLFLPWLSLCLVTLCETPASLQVPPDFHLGLYYFLPPGVHPAVHRVEISEAVGSVSLYLRWGNRANIIKLIPQKYGMNAISWLPSGLSISVSIFYHVLPYIFYSPIFGCRPVNLSLSFSSSYLFLSSQFLSVTWIFFISWFLPFYHLRETLACAFYLSLSIFTIDEWWKNNCIFLIFSSWSDTMWSNWDSFKIMKDILLYLCV